jgi:hypothetical protein
MKDIVTKLNESYGQVEFTVAFIDAIDKEGIPFSTNILVENKYKEAFKEYLEKEKGNTVYMAADWKGDPIGED